MRVITLVAVGALAAATTLGAIAFEVPSDPPAPSIPALPSLPPVPSIALPGGAPPPPPPAPDPLSAMSNLLVTVAADGSLRTHRIPCEDVREVREQALAIAELAKLHASDVREIEIRARQVEERARRVAVEARAVVHEQREAIEQARVAIARAEEEIRAAEQQLGRN